MRAQTFVTQGVNGNPICVYLDADHRDYRGRVRGVVRFYDMRYRGEAPRGSQGRGFTVDGQFIASMYAEEFIPEKRFGLCLDGGMRDWAISPRQLTVVRDWIHLVYASLGESIPEYI